MKVTVKKVPKGKFGLKAGEIRVEIAAWGEIKDVAQLVQRIGDAIYAAAKEVEAKKLAGEK